MSYVNLLTHLFVTILGEYSVHLTDFRSLRGYQPLALFVHREVCSLPCSMICARGCRRSSQAQEWKVGDQPYMSSTSPVLCIAKSKLVVI